MDNQIILTAGEKKNFINSLVIKILRRAQSKNLQENKFSANSRAKEARKQIAIPLRYIAVASASTSWSNQVLIGFLSRYSACFAGNIFVVRVLIAALPSWVFRGQNSDMHCLRISQ